MKKLGLTVFSVICAICMAFGIMLMTNVNKVSADTVDGDIPVLSETKYKISTDKGGLLIATGIKNYNDVYKVGYTGLDGTTGNKSETKYYSSIKSGTNTWTAQQLFGEEFTGMIVWEINYDPAEYYEYSAFVEYGYRINGNLVKYDPVRNVSATSKITPIVINNKSDLDAFGDALLADETAGKQYVLGADIDYGGETWAAGRSLSTVFKGTLDGRGHKISGYNCQRGLFAEMSKDSVVKNLYVEPDLAGNSAGGAICYKNYGRIENCAIALNVLNGDTAQFSGVVTSNRNEGATGVGEIANCIVKVASYSGDGTRFPAIAAVYNEQEKYQGDFSNCYAISHYSDYMYGSVTAGLYANDNAFFTSVTELPETNGWNDYWSIVDGELCFGGNKIAENLIDKTATAVFDYDRNSGSDYTLTVTGIDAGLTSNIGITAVKTVSGTTLAFEKSGANDIVFANATLSGFVGEQQVYLVTSAAKYKIIICMADMIINDKDDLDDFGALLTSNTATGYYVLGADIDYDGANWAPGLANNSSELGGTLDGRGHKISNFVCDWGFTKWIAAGSKIENLYFGVKLNGTKPNAGGGICTYNYGIIRNCAVVIDIVAGDGAYFGGVVNIHRQARIENCFVKIASYTGNTTGRSFGAIADTKVASDAVIISNCYAVSAYSTNMYSISGGSTVTTGLYADDNAFLDAVTELPEANGWNNYWSIVNGELCFGGNKIAEKVVDKTDTAIFDFDRTSGSNYTMDLTATGIDAGLMSNADITAVKTISGTMLAFTKSGDNALIFANATLSGFIGEQQVYLVTSAAKYKVTICMASNILTTKDQFVAYFNANASKTTSADTYVVLKSDINLENANWDNVYGTSHTSTFTGTFDGRGHKVYNFSGRRGLFIDLSSTATVKNLFVAIKLNGGYQGGGICWFNYGRIENCAIVIDITEGDGTYWGGVTHTNQSGATIANCFVKIASYTGNDRGRTFNAIADTGSGISNCYAVSSYSSYMYGTNNSGLYGSDTAFFTAINSLSVSNGWNGYWSIADGTLSFGGNIVIANS